MARHAEQRECATCRYDCSYLWLTLCFLCVFSYKFRVDALLLEAEFDSVLDNVQSGVDAISFTATGSFTHRTVCQVVDDFIDN